MPVQAEAGPREGPAPSRKGLALGCLAALALACLGLSSSPRPDPLLGAWLDPVGGAVRTSSATSFMISMILGLGGLSFLLGVALRSALRRPERPLTLARILLDMAATTLLMVLLIGSWKILAVHGGPTPVAGGQSEPPLQAAPIGAAAPPLVSPPARAPGHPALPPGLVLVGLVLLPALAGMLLVRQPRPIPARAAGEPAPSVPQAAARARRRLESGDPVRDVVIACYAEMCEVFAGGPGSAADSRTAREFADDLRRRGAGEPEILALTRIFEKARYSVEPCGPFRAGAGPGGWAPGPTSPAPGNTRPGIRPGA